MSSDKLPHPPRGSSRRSQRNAWLVADRMEKIKLTAVTLLLAAILGAGAYLIVVGIRS